MNSSTMKDIVMAVITAAVLAVAAYQTLHGGQLDAQWGVFTGLVIGYYFRSPDSKA